ncbi:hypothetical protein MHYP_G00348920 [Metynnis hypsauchen]
MFVPVLVFVFLGLSEAAATGPNPGFTPTLPALTPATATFSSRVTTIELPTTDPTTPGAFGRQKAGQSLMSDRAQPHAMENGQELVCNCSAEGALDPDECDRDTGQCVCMVGYTGLQCEECEEDHFTNGTDGCLPCGCDSFGAVSPHCDSSNASMNSISQNPLEDHVPADPPQHSSHRTLPNTNLVHLFLLSQARSIDKVNEESELRKGSSYALLAAVTHYAVSG